MSMNENNSQSANFSNWFDGLEYWDHSINYSKPHGLEDPVFISHIFTAFEENIVLMVRRRCLPTFRKEIEGRSKLFVGYFYPNHWEMYKHNKLRGPNPCKFHYRSFYSPGFKGNVKEKRESLVWKDCPLPLFCNSEYWSKNKWWSDGVVWRSWLMEFEIVWNSFNCTVYVKFKYNCQFFSTHFNKWIDH